MKVIFAAAAILSFAGGLSLVSAATVKSGSKVPDSGIYREVGGSKRSTLVKGEPAPPTSKKGSGWRQVVDTNPSKKKKR